MPALVEREVASAGVGVGVVFLEAVADVFGLAFDGDPHAHANVVGDLAAVGVERRDHLDHALALEHAAFATRPRDERNLVDARRRVTQAVAWHREPGGVRHCGQFDGGFGAVEEAVEHLRVEPTACRLLGREAVVAPHRLGRRFAEMRQPLVAAPCGDDGEAASARPVDEVANESRLIAERERIDDTGVGRLACEQRSAQRVGFDGHVDDMLAVARRFEAVVDGRDRMPGAFDDDVDRRVANERGPVVADMRRAQLDRFVERCGLRALGCPADACEVAPCRVGREICDAGEMHAGNARQLREVHRPELAGADESDAHRLALGSALLQLRIQAHGSRPFRSRPAT